MRRADNGHGPYRVDFWEDFAAYDRLPPVLRRAVQQAVNTYACGRIEKHFKSEIQRGHAARPVCLAIIRGMAAQDRQSTLEFYGADHPEAPPPHNTSRAERTG